MEIMMIKAKALLLASVSVFLLAGCSTNSVEQARVTGTPGKTFETVVDATPVKKDFSGYLEKNYKALALFEADKMEDWGSAENYADKSLAAGQGVEVAPELVASYDIPVEYLAEITSAEGQMYDLMDKGVNDFYPADTASMQAHFDCWLEQQEENIQPEHIRYCKEKFTEAVGMLYSGMEPAAGEASSIFETIYFMFDSTQLKDGEDTKVNALGMSLQEGGMITISGFTDTSGTEEYNKTLSRHRAETLKNTLIKKFDLLPSQIEIEAKGQFDLEVPTADEVYEPQNRRAIIRR